MPSLFDQYELEGWMDAFSKHALDNGLGLYSNGQVSQLDFTPTSTVGEGVVQAAPGLSMVVHVRLVDAFSKHPSLLGNCPCSGETNCQHVAAVVLAAILEKKLSLRLTPRDSVAETAEEVETNGLNTLPDVVNQWLMTFEKSDQTDQSLVESYPVYIKKRILYLLLPKENRRDVELASVIASVLKNGNYSNTHHPYSFNYYNTHSPAYVKASDYRIARMTGLFRTNSLGRVEVQGPDFPMLIHAMVETGRLHWDSIQNVPLVLGEARSAEPRWITLADGTQRAVFETTPPSTWILPIEPPWYVDVEVHCIGPVKTAMKRTAAALWLSAPDLLPRTATTLSQFLEKPNAPVSIPKPKSIEIQRREGATPVPILVLHTKRLHWWQVGLRFGETGVDGLPVNYCKVCFDYEGLRTSSNNPSNVLEKMKLDHIVQMVRNRHTELGFISTLSQLGLVVASYKQQMGGALKDDLDQIWVLPKSKPEDWFQFVSVELPKFEQKGWRFEYDASFDFKLAHPQDWYVESQSDQHQEWFDLELGVLVDGERINLLPVLLNLIQSKNKAFSLKALRKHKDGKIVLTPLGDGRLLPFPAARLRGILETLTELYDPNALSKKKSVRLPKLRAAEIASLGKEPDWRWDGAERLREIGLRLKDFKGIQTIKPPTGLKATLRPYQKDGLNWLQFLREYELAGILADDMGLGKTVQALAHILVEKRAKRLDRPCLVVAPTSLMVNWRQEVERFAPKLRLLISHGNERKQHFDRLETYDLVVTSYSLLSRDQEILLSTDFHLVILDEAQYIKNTKSQFAQIACRLRARHRLCMTGTPMENHLGELWSQFNFLSPGFLGDHVRFRSIFRSPIERQGDKERRDMLARRVAPFILRRRKDDVMKDLPPKSEILRQVELADDQRDLYESIRLAMHARVREEIASRGMNRSQIIILDALLKLRQVCCDPRLVKLDAAKKVQGSAKLELLRDLLPEMISEGRRILLFSQFTSMLELIELEVNRLKIPFVKLTGSTADRETPVMEFQSRKVPLFLISLKAGGTGLNLTAADTVIHYDPWWNPAVETQATDRAHRIGQDKKVFVYKLMTVGTVEEKIAALQLRKRELVDGLLNEERRESLQLTPEDLEVLFEPLS